MSSGSRNPDLHTSLLATGQDEIHGHVHYKCSPKEHSDSSSGGWRSASFLLGGEILERFAYNGIEPNLINFLTGQLKESVATAAANVNTWIGVVSVVPTLGALLADSYIGRYRSIVIFSILYILGIGCLTLSATIISSTNWNSQANEESGQQTKAGILVFVSLYIVALAQGYKACVQAFGADQFDGNNLPENSRAKSSFFNWWTSGMAIGAGSAHLILHYIQDNISWGIGFGIPCFAMIVGLFLFFLGNGAYRFPAGVGDEENLKERKPQQSSKVEDISKIVIPESSNSITGCKQDSGMTIHQHEKDLQNITTADDNGSTDTGANSKHANYYKEPRNVIKLLPIWISCLTFTITRAQTSTLFIKQATSLNRSIAPNLNIPAATLKIFSSVSILLFIPIYDWILVPVARKVTRHSSGITMLQRMGTGMAISVFNMVIAAIIEHKRLKTARDHGLVDIPNATVPMSFWWLIPQFILIGLVYVFTEVAMQEFFYDQVPIELRSVGVSFYHGALGIGNFLSSFLVSLIDRITSQNGNGSWFADNLNQAHIDYFYWLLAGIGAAGFIVFLHLSKSYDYRGKHVLENCSSHEKTSLGPSNWGIGDAVYMH